MQDFLVSLRSAFADLRSESPRTLVLVAVCGLVVAIGPLALALTRKDEYRAFGSIAQRAELAELTPAENVAGVELVMGASLGSPDLQRAVARGAGGWLSAGQVTRHVTLEGRWREGRPEVLITTRASAPDDARTLAVAVSRALSQRAELVARLGDAYAILLRDGGRAFEPPGPVQAESERPTDSVIAAVPGRMPPRPEPLWALVAGLALAAALIIVVLAFGRPRQLAP